MKAKYRSSIRSVNLIKEAVISLLMKKKDLNSITISDIVKEANINRGTFYNHFNNVSEVVGAIEDDMMKELTTSLAIFSSSNEISIPIFVNQVTAYLKSKDDIYKQIIKYIPNYIFDDMKAKMLIGIKNNMFILPSASKVSDKELKADFYFLANGLAGTYIDYFSGKLDVTLDELADYSNKFLSKVLKS